MKAPQGGDCDALHKEEIISKEKLCNFNIQYALVNCVGFLCIFDEFCLIEIVAVIIGFFIAFEFRSFFFFRPFRRFFISASRSARLPALFLCRQQLKRRYRRSQANRDGSRYQRNSIVHRKRRCEYGYAERHARDYRKRDRRSDLYSAA